MKNLKKWLMVFVISVLVSATQTAFCADIIVNSYTKAGLPAAGTAGRIARVTDDIRGLWMDQGSQWFQVAGGWVNVEEYDSFAVAITDIGSAVRTLMIPTSKTVAANVNVPATLTLWFVGEGQLSINTGITSTINGPIIAPPNKRIFAGAGTVTFGSGARQRHVWADWWGADPTGVVDSATFITVAINAVGAAGGGIVDLNAGTYEVSQGQVDIIVSNVWLRGQGWDATMLKNNNEKRIVSVGYITPVKNVRVTSMYLFSTGGGNSPGSEIDGRGMLYFDASSAVVTDCLAEDVKVEGSRLTGISISGSRNILSHIWVKNVGEHGIYFTGNAGGAAAEGQKILNSHIESPGFRITGGTNAIKIAGGANGVQICNVTIVMGTTANGGILTENTSYHAQVGNVRVTLGAASQVAFDIRQTGFVGSNLIVDGGNSFSGVFAVDFKSTAASSRIEQLKTLGTWISEPITIRTGATDIVIDGGVIIAAPAGGFAVELNASTRPVIRNLSILGGPNGIRLGTSTGARIIDNQVLTTTSKYDTSGPPTGYIIVDQDDFISGLLIGTGTKITNHISGTTTWDPPSISNGTATSTTVTVPGAAVGDTVAVGFSQAVPGKALLVGAVTATNTVTVTLFNNTGGALNLASGTLRADVWKH